MSLEISTPDSAHESLVSLPCTAPATSLPSLQIYRHQPVGDNVEASAHGQSTYTLASPQQWEAISVLCEVDTCTVLAWLTGHKSSPPVNPEWFQSRSLSCEQFAALSALKGCPNSLVFAWLDCARRIGKLALTDNDWVIPLMEDQISKPVIPMTHNDLLLLPRSAYRRGYPPPV
jgi:hypothetical protein